MFEALEYEGPDEDYEKLEDDFVDIANCGENCLDSKKNMFETKPISKEKTKQKIPEDFEKTMKEMDDDENLPRIPEVLNKRDFKRIVDEYIHHMQKKHGTEDNESEEEEEEEEGLGKDEGIYIKNPNLNSELKDKIKPEEIFTSSKFYEKLDFNEDISLQQYLNKESDSDEEIELPKKTKPNYVNLDTDTIENAVHNENPKAPVLNIIKENPKNPKKKKLTEEKEKENEDEGVHNEEENDEKQKDLKEIFKKRVKNETAEEKAERKANIKAFKQERKEKKHKFKEAFKNQHLNEIRKSKPNHNIPHVSVYKL